MDRIGKHLPYFIIVVIYSVGVAGFLMPSTRDRFAEITWASLLISFILLLYYQEKTTPSFWISIAIIGLSGFFLEIIGVRTGMLFGNYYYGPNLGIKAMDVPLMIGVNWILLVYLSSYISKDISRHHIVSVLLAAAFMTGLDVLIEPFAIQFGLWHWRTAEIPLQNYAMWFIIGLGMNHLFQKMNPEIRNPAARPLAACLAIFFLLIDLLVVWS